LSFGNYTVTVVTHLQLPNKPIRNNSIITLWNTYIANDKFLCFEEKKISNLNQLWFYFISIVTHSQLFYDYQAARCGRKEMQTCEMIDCNAIGLGMDKFESNELDLQ
jgi:hypothetical protein